MKLAIHHIDGNPLNNDPANLRRVRVSTNTVAAEKRPRGRPAVSPEQKLLVGSVRLTQEHWDKLERLGDGEWLRKQIDRAKVKP